MASLWATSVNTSIGYTKTEYAAYYYIIWLNHYDRVPTAKAFQKIPQQISIIAKKNVNHKKKRRKSYLDVAIREKKIGKTVHH